MRRARKAAGTVTSAEQLDDRARKARELVKRRNDWLRREYAGPPKRDLDAEQNIVMRRFGGNPRQHDAVFQIKDGRIRKFGIDADTPKTPSLGSGSGMQNLPMFSLNVEIVDGVKQVVSPTVRQEIFDSMNIFGRKLLYFFQSPIAVVEKRSAASTDWKVDVFWIGVAVSLGEADGQQIERTAHHVDDDPNFGADDPREWMPDIEFQRVLSALRIELGDDFVWGAVRSRLRSGPRALGVGLGPFVVEIAERFTLDIGNRTIAYMITRSVAERSLAALILWSARLNWRGAKPTARATEGGGLPELLHTMRARDRLMAA